MTKVVHVQAPARLHFGMFGPGPQRNRQFGGVGMMVSSPGVELEFTAAERLSSEGPLAERAEMCLRRAARLLGFPEPKIALRIRHVPEEHTGLGAGTQLHLAITAGLLEFLGLPLPEPALLAQAAGRGSRSAVGTYGFLYGGLIVDGGKGAEQTLGTLVARHNVPPGWRVVLVRTGSAQGRAGSSEQQAFRELPPTPARESEHLRAIVMKRMLPALERGDCDDFGEAVYEFGMAAGALFAPVQGGPFASTEIAQLVHRIREWGVSGVGQSSWGPTVFAIGSGQQQAEELQHRLKEYGVQEQDIILAEPDNVGARIG